MLIVDDEADLSETLARLLGRLGHTCLVAASGSEAIRLIDTMTPDLVVTDLHMPGGTLYLAKPFANADMLDAVQRALDSRKGIPARECHRLRAAVALVEGTDGFQSAMGDAQPRMARGLKPEASRAVGDPARREKEAEMFSVVPTLSEEAASSPCTRLAWSSAYLRRCGSRS